MTLKKKQNEVSQERAEQLKVKSQQIRQQQEGTNRIVITIITHSVLAEDIMYACLWEEDRLAKCKREEMETIMQTERNRETLKVPSLGDTADANVATRC